MAYDNHTGGGTKLGLICDLSPTPGIFNSNRRSWDGAGVGGRFVLWDVLRPEQRDTAMLLGGLSLEWLQVLGAGARPRPLRWLHGAPGSCTHGHGPPCCRLLGSPMCTLEALGSEGLRPGDPEGRRRPRRSLACAEASSPPLPPTSASSHLRKPCAQPVLSDSLHPLR